MGLDVACRGACHGSRAVVYHGKLWRVLPWRVVVLAVAVEPWYAMALGPSL